MSTILVTGAAGNLGQRVTAALAARSDVGRVLAVDLEPLPAVAPSVEPRPFDLAKRGAADQLADMAKQADVFLHLAWAPEGRRNLLALQNVLSAAAAVQPLQLVHLSSATVYGAWPDNPVPMVEEVTPRPNPGSAYASEKYAAEQVVRDWGARHPQVRVAVLRPACTVGSTEKPLYQALASTRRTRAGDPGRTVQFLHVEDLASAVVHVFDRALCGTYNVATDSGLSEAMAGKLGGAKTLLPLPPMARRATAALGWSLWRGGTPPGVRPYTEHSWVVAGDKLRQTGWQPGYTSEEALVASDEKAHWDEVPLGARAAWAAGGLAALASGVAATWWRAHRRHN